MNLVMSVYFNTDIALESDDNLFLGAATCDVLNEISLSEWVTWGYDAHSFEDDPLFVSSSNLHIQSGSPAIDAGLNLYSFVSEDIDGQARDTLFDIGADELSTSRGQGVVSTLENWIDRMSDYLGGRANSKVADALAKAIV